MNFMLYRLCFALLWAGMACAVMPLFADTYAACNGPMRRTHNELGPNLAFGLTPPPLTKNVAIALLGEAGRKNYRVSGTLGFFASPLHRFKFSGEQLSQQLNYRFASGKRKRSVGQFAVGGIYQYCLPVSFIDSLEVSSSYSQASGRTLTSFSCATLPESILYRRIAGGREGHIAVGGTLLPWSCARLSLAADYDRVLYKRKFGDDHKIGGFGGTVGIQQGLPCDLMLEFQAQFRRPFYFYIGGLNWKYATYNGKLTVGLYASHTNGRNQLPNNSVCGLYIGYAFGGGPIFGGYYPGTRCYSYGCCASSCAPFETDLMAWVARPAIAMPIVVATVEQEFVEQ